MAEPVISTALMRLVAAIERQRAAASAGRDMTPADLLALSQVERVGEVSPTRLARVLMLSSSGTTSVIHRLTAAGLVERVPASGSGARRAIRATAEGRALLAAVSAPLDAAVAEAAGELSTGDRARMEGFLVRVADAAERVAEGAVAEVAAASRAAQAVSPPLRWG